MNVHLTTPAQVESLRLARVLLDTALSNLGDALDVLKTVEAIDPDGTATPRCPTPRVSGLRSPISVTPFGHSASTSPTSCGR